MLDLRAIREDPEPFRAGLARRGAASDLDRLLTLDEKERARFRQRALEWLRGDLTAWRQILDQEPQKVHSAVQATLQHWQEDADFSGVRGDALTRLPEAERRPWQQLWADVRQTLSKASRQAVNDTKQK